MNLFHNAMNYEYGAHTIDWQVMFMLLALAFICLVYSEPESKALKLVFGVSAAGCIVLVFCIRTVTGLH